VTGCWSGKDKGRTPEGLCRKEIQKACPDSQI